MAVVNPYPNDPVHPGILETAGADVLYRQASGFEKALADVDAQRLTAIYAELVRDQWDPYKISYRNLAYLAWAMGVNLWEDDWPEAFRRFWVANQWTYKSQRGSKLGLVNFVYAISAGGKVSSEVIRVITPPATTFPLAQVANVITTLNALVPGALYDGPLSNTRHSYENELTWLDTRAKPVWQDLVNYEHAQYIARFAQLRGYPFVGLSPPQTGMLRYGSMSMKPPVRLDLRASKPSRRAARRALASRAFSGKQFSFDIVTSHNCSVIRIL